jgi:hypothetical protein
MTTLILDIDGVLITTPPWKPDSVHADGYSDFNEKCVANLNQLLSTAQFEIWLSSTRRTVKTLDEFNQIFSNRLIKQEIVGFLPASDISTRRKDEVEAFIRSRQLTDFLVLDDDSSLNDFSHPEKAVVTRLTIGFDEEKLEEAVKKITTATTNYKNRA